MKLLPKVETRPDMNPHKRLALAIKQAAKADPNFIDAAVSKAVEELNKDTAKKPTKDAEVVLCTINRDHLIDALGEALYYKLLARACELKTKAAELRYVTAMDRFWQKVCDFHNLDDEEPMHLDPINLLRILSGHGQSKVEVLQEEVVAILESDDKELERLIEKHQRGSFEGDLAFELQGDNSEKVVELGKALFSSDDRTFLAAVAKDDDIPKPLRLIAGFILEHKD